MKYFVFEFIKIKVKNAQENLGCVCTKTILNWILLKSESFLDPTHLDNNIENWTLVPRSLFRWDQFSVELLNLS